MLHFSRHTQGLWFAVFGALAFSGKAIIVKLAYRYGADAVTLLMLRMLFALPLFVLLAWWSGRGQRALTRTELLAVLGLGFCGYYLSSYLDFLGLQYISASLERLILYLNPTLVLLLGWALFKRRVGPVQMAAMALSYGGVVLVFAHELHFEGAHVGLGAALVLASAVSYASYLTFSGEWVKRLGSLRLVGWASSVACVLCIAQFTVLRDWSVAANAAPQVWGLSVLNAVFCTVLPILLVMFAIERIGAGLTAQTGMLGVVATIVLGVWLLDEQFTTWTALGSLMVLGGVYGATRVKLPTPNKSENSALAN